MNTVTILNLPLPPRVLTPNSNIHWRVVNEPKAEYRKKCFEAAKGIDVSEGKLRMQVTFCIKGARGKCTHRVRINRKTGRPRACLLCPYTPHDESNALAAFKAGQDGIFDALGRKDSRKNLSIGAVRIDATRGPWVEVVLEGVG